MLLLHKLCKEILFQNQKKVNGRKIALNVTDSREKSEGVLTEAKEKDHRT